MTTEAHWEQEGYGEIVGVESSFGALTVRFANGDVVELQISDLGLPNDSEFRFEDETGVLVAIPAGGDEREVDWMLIRRIDDPLFAEALRERDAEESRRIGRRLGALRENNGISQKDAARLAGMAPSQLAKIESGKVDLRVSTVQKVLRALGGTLADISRPDAPEISMNAIRKNAEATGAPKELLEKIAEQAGPEGFPKLLSHGFGWEIEALLGGRPETPPLDIAVSFKARDRERAKHSPQARLAYAVSRIAAGFYEKPTKALADDPGLIREQIGAGEGSIALQALIEWAWEMGIMVVPTPGTKGVFSGAAWNVDGRPVAVLSSPQASPPFWLFDLAHEIGHLALGHPLDGGVVEVDKQGGAIDDAHEKEADRFALELLLPDREKLFAEIRKRCEGSLEWQKRKFKWKVIEVAEEAGVDEALLATTAAAALTEIAEPVDRWGSAQNIAKEQGKGRQIAQAAFAKRIDLDALGELDAALLQVAVLE
jgi:transcriptional regulator with XRE-family HTH domain/Zn-dependent peptidase ImmA (M78 family)